jgi:thiol-disulfide isomerase/thioredoxin
VSTACVLKSRNPVLSKSAVLIAGVAAIAVFGASRAQAGPIAWRRDLRRACREAAQCRRPLLVVVGARWCGPCRKMHAETFPNPAVVARVNSQFVPVLLDADAQTNDVKQLGVEAFPTVLVVSPEQKIIGRLTGFQSAAQLNARLASYLPAPFRSSSYRTAPPQPAPELRAPQEHPPLNRPSAAAQKPWGQRMWDAIRASPPRTTLGAAVAFSTGR